tara:strand:+ start:485 stop:679 length:195 start_codon:yes stop_codon:yes gene_type:complete
VEVGDLVAREWPALDDGSYLIGIIIEKRPAQPPVPSYFLVQWTEPYHIIEAMHDYELRVINASR